MIADVIDLLKWLWGKFKWLFVVFMPFMGVIAFFKDGLVLFIAGVEDLTSRVAEIRVMVTASLGTVTPYLSYANAFFPLTEVFAMAALWAGIKVTIVVIRLIKGVIPTYG